ncbi:hypothetical protein TELCIR_19784, partial [Teladorsagia circumcincta]
HGNRNPEVFLDENPRTWGFEGDAELTSSHQELAQHAWPRDHGANKPNTKLCVLAMWKPIDEDLLPNLAEAKRKHAPLLNYVGQKTGWNMTSLGKLADLADNLIEIDMYNASYPDWLLRPDLPGYDRDKIIDEIMGFAEMPQIACTNYAPCRDLMAGV